MTTESRAVTGVGITYDAEGPALLRGLRNRDCPVCGAGASDARPFLSASIDPERIGRFSFASRKVPEFMSFRLGRCRDCETVYAIEAPKSDALAEAYREADYDSGEEAIYAARTYARVLAPKLGPIERGEADRGVALEIGAGTGVFLRELQDLGFADVLGIEPSLAAIEAAPPDLRSHLRVGVFDSRDHAPGSLSLICCFQTLEHVPDPREMTRAAFELLRPGGCLALVTHDYQAALNRVLGRRSPIIDIEHMQLFCRPSLTRLLGDAGFEGIDIQSIRNSYPLRYWMRLLPLPGRMKASIAGIAETLGLADRLVAMNVGNLLSVARKPR